MRYLSRYSILLVILGAIALVVGCGGGGGDNGGGDIDILTARGDYGSPEISAYINQ
jgi:hypothetical protein